MEYLEQLGRKRLILGIGINGIIRKAGMVISIIFFGLIDFILSINFIGFLPETILEFINIKSVGISDLFSLLFIVFEILSIFKNMIKCKLPIPKKLQKWLEKILNEFTQELKESEEKK